MIVKFESIEIRLRALRFSMRDKLRVIRNKFLESKHFNAILAKGWRYWVAAFVMALAGWVVGYYISDFDSVVRLRLGAYQLLQEKPNPRSATHSRRTVIVLISDDDFWKGRLARRRPLKKTYIADLLRKLDAADPAAIGVDLDLDSQTPDRSVIFHVDYLNEIRYFLAAVREVSNNRPVILARSLFRDAQGKLSVQPAMFDEPRHLGKKVREGFIDLPHDIIKIPLYVRRRPGPDLDSFAAALVRCVDYRTLAEARKGGELPYGTFMGRDAFQPLSAGAVLRMDIVALKEKVQHQIVIIGGEWHEDMFKRGSVVDVHLTPAGELSGSFVHGNYVEALLYNQTYKPWQEAIAVSVEIGLSLAVAVVFSLSIGTAQRIMWLGLVMAGLVFLAIMSLQNLGHFFDFFLPAVLLTLHGLAARVIEWREAYLRDRANFGSPAYFR